MFDKDIIPLPPSVLESYGSAASSIQANPPPTSTNGPVTATLVTVDPSATEMATVETPCTEGGTDGDTTARAGMGNVTDVANTPAGTASTKSSGATKGQAL